MVRSATGPTTSTTACARSWIQRPRGDGVFALIALFVDRGFPMEPFAEALAMIADGRISDGETIAALAFAGIRLGRFV